MAQQDVPPRHEVVVVTGAPEPIPLDEAGRPVRVLDLEDRPPAASATDLLRLDPSLDLRARAPGGVQGDLFIRGAGFGQTLVLLDGLRLNDAQSGHHNLDIPVPADTLERIEVLKGSGSAFYGSDAVGGVVNLITREPEYSEFRLRGWGGSFGRNGQSGIASVIWRTLSEQLTFSRDFSSGFMPDRDFRNLSLASITRARSGLGSTSVTLAHTDRPFGADQFYGNYNSWERTRTWFGSIRQELGKATEIAFAFRRHTDLFVLYRDRPEVFTNRHATTGEQAAFRRREEPGGGVAVHYGGEWYRDTIRSTNLGDHARQRGAAYAALDARSAGRFSFSAAAREEFYSSGRGQFSPTLAAGWWLSSHWKLRAGAGRAFRLPSYTDLYYHDPANVGSPDLRPETAWNYEAGADWYGGRRIRGALTVFHRRERDGIDYVRSSPADIWRAANFQRLDFSGVETTLSLAPAPGQRVDLGYTALHGAAELSTVWMSKYAFNYPRHNASVSWHAALPGGIVLRTRVAALARLAREPYPLWDASAAYTRGRVRPFVECNNLTGTLYQEIPGVPMPGRGITAGAEFILAGTK